MEYEAIPDFLRNPKKEVKLEYNNGFILRGEIVSLYRDSFLFKTKQQESIIYLSDVKSVVG